MNSIYIPKDLDQAKEIATLLDNRNPSDLLKVHAAYGGHFGFDMGLVSTQAYCLKGKPSLGADAMSGICRRSKLVRYMRITSWDESHCTMQFARVDEPVDIVHEFTFTIEMAKAQGLTRNRNWQQMPLQMLRSRVLTMGLRATYPDAVSGIYSADEIADNTEMSDDERAIISADSLGVELRSPQQSRAPTSAPYQKKVTSRPPQPVEPVEPVDLPEPPQLKAEPLYEFANEADFWAIVDDHNISVEEVNSVAKRQGEQIADMTPDELEAFFYKYVIHRTVRQSWSHVEQWWKDPRQDFILKTHDAMALEYPIIADAPPAFYGPRLHEPAFVEALRQSCSMDEKHKAECQRVIRYMRSDDWSKYYELVELAKT